MKFEVWIVKFEYWLDFGFELLIWNLILIGSLRGRMVIKGVGTQIVLFVPVGLISSTYI